jgi:hypothetical protein
MRFSDACLVVGVMALLLSAGLGGGLGGERDGGPGETSSEMPSAGCSEDAPSETTETASPVDDIRDWTIAVYWAGDNNLDPDTDTFISLWMQSLWNREDVALSVFIDRSSFPANMSTLTEKGWTEITRYTEEVNSSSPSVLSDFMTYTLTDPALKADRYMLMLLSHGLGYMGLCVDEGEPNRPWMPVDSLGSALDSSYTETGKRFDIVDIDACTMGCVEVAYELRDRAGYLVASQLAVPFDGINYRALLGGLSDDSDVSPVDLARKMVEDYAEWYSAPLGTYPTLYPYMQDFATLSVVNLSLIGEVGRAFSQLSACMVQPEAKLMGPFKEAVRTSFVALWMNNMACGFYSDVQSLLEEFASRVEGTHPTVADACTEVIQAACNAIEHSWASERLRDRMNGLSVFVPPGYGIFTASWDTLQRVYDTVGLDFVEQSGWGSVIDMYCLPCKSLG